MKKAMDAQHKAALDLSCSINDLEAAEDAAAAFVDRTKSAIQQGVQQVGTGTGR